jgi:hypothetical protein
MQPRAVLFVDTQVSNTSVSHGSTPRSSFECPRRSGPVASLVAPVRPVTLTHALMPPSTSSEAPVMLRALSLARNTTALAMSSGVA